MTAISPLQSIHKKGLFGDHHKKDERKLLNISEVKDLTIVQIVQYKRSKVQLNSVLVDGLEFPLQSSKVLSNRETRILWNAPNTWLVISRKENISESNKSIKGMPTPINTTEPSRLWFPLPIKFRVSFPGFRFIKLIYN